jgi:hypothetical protein
VYVVRLLPGQREGTEELEADDATVLEDDEEVSGPDVDVWLELDVVSVLDLDVDIAADELEGVADTDWVVEKLSVVDWLLDVLLVVIVLIDVAAPLLEYTPGISDMDETMLEVLLVAADVTLVTPVLVIVMVREIRLLELLNRVDVLVGAPLLVRESEVVGRETGLRLRDDPKELVVDWLEVCGMLELEIRIDELIDTMDDEGDIGIDELIEYIEGTGEETDVVNAVGGELLVDSIRLEEMEVNPRLVDSRPVADDDVEPKFVDRELRLDTLVWIVDIDALVDVALSPGG